MELLIEQKYFSGPHSKNEWVVVVTVSEWYNDMFENWLFWYKKLNLDMEVILVAEDEFIRRKYSNDTMLSLISFDISPVSLLH